MVDIPERVIRVVGFISLDACQEQSLVHGYIDELNGLESGIANLFDKRFRKRLVFSGQDRLGIEVNQVVFQDPVFQVADLNILRDFQLLECVVQAEKLLVCSMPQSPQEGRGKKLATAAPTVHVDPDQIVRVEFNLYPGTAIGNNPHRVQGGAVGMQGLLRADARAAVKLADNHPLCAVNDKGSVPRHERDFTHVDVLFTHFIPVFQTKRDVQRRRIGQPLIQTVQAVKFRLRKLVSNVVQYIPTVITFDRKNFFEQGLQALLFTFSRIDLHLQEIAVRFRLNGNQIWGLNDGLQFSEVFSFGHPGTSL